MTNTQQVNSKQSIPALLVILGIVVLAVAGGIWYVAGQGKETINTANAPVNANVAENDSNSITQNANQTNVNTDPYAGWKNYKDSRKNIRLRYPGRLVIRDEEGQVDFVDLAADTVILSLGPDLPAPEALDRYITDTAEQNENEILRLEPKRIGEVQGRDVYLQLKNGRKEQRYMFVVNGVLYNLFTINTDDELMSQFWLIVETLKAV